MINLSENLRILISFFILTMLILLAYGWSQTQKYIHFQKSGDVSVAKIHKKTVIDGAYFIEYSYHDNITAQGYADEKQISKKLWDTLSQNQEFQITYNKKKATQNILFVLDSTKIWEPLVQAVQVVIICSVLFLSIFGAYKKIVKK